MQCSSYRPISLLNVDLKLFTKILATRLTPFLPTLVHWDQVGFVPSREGRDNTIRVLSLIHRAQAGGTGAMLLSTDAEKAFDRVSWDYMSAVLRHLGLGPHMLAWMLASYSVPSAVVRVNGTTSSSFSLSNGTRQGCPLSPLIFILCLEPFLRTIRLNDDIKGISCGGSQHKVAAYADDLVFFISSPEISLPNVMAELRDFQHFSSYKVNYQKSEALNISLSPRRLSVIKPNFPFKWAHSSINYLGTVIPSDLTRLFPLNFPPLLRRVEEDLRRWSGGAFSWMGRINVLKMNVLPKFLYLFQALPIWIPPPFLRRLRSTFARFIWNARPARLSYDLVHTPKLSGGLGASDVEAYYRAAHLARVIDWCRHAPTKQWVTMEQSFTPVPLHSLPWLDCAQPELTTRHPLLAATCRIAKTCFTKLSLSPHPSPLYPILGNPLFPPGLEDPIFRSWSKGQVFRAKSFVSGTAWSDLLKLGGTGGLPDLGFWRRLQLTHFLSSLSPPTDFGRDLTEFENLCLDQGPLTHAISALYSILKTPSDSFVPWFLAKWEADLDRTFTPAQRSDMYFFAHKSSISSRTQETNFKLLSRWYRTPERLHSLFPDQSSSCWRCGDTDGNLLHIFWSCPKLSIFWSQVRAIILKLTGLDIPNDPAVFLLHLPPMPRKRYKASLSVHLINAAKACIPALWRSPDPPTIASWLARIRDVSRMEELTASLYDRTDKYCRVWSPWLLYVDSPDYASALAL